MEVKAWSSFNFHMKGTFETSYVLQVEIHKNYFKIPLVKGIILGEELYLNS